MPLLWPLDTFKRGAITHFLTYPKPSQFNLCDSPSLSSPALTETWQPEHRIHQFALWRNWSLQSIPTSEAIGTAAAAAEASGVLWLVCDLSIFRQRARHGINMQQAAHISLVTQQGWEGRGGERGSGRWDDDMALQSSRGVNPKGR